MPDSPTPGSAENVRLTVAAQDERSAVEAGETASTLRTAGQRKINLIWERTHAAIAILVTSVTLSVCAYLVVVGRGHEGAFQLLGNVFFIVVGTCFQRTNHVRTGGVGKEDAGR